MKLLETFVYSCAILMLLASSALASIFSDKGLERTHLKELTLLGKIIGENVVFDLDFDVYIAKDDREIPVVSGAIAYQGSTVAGKHKLVRNKDGYSIRFDRGGHYKGRFSFASRPRRDGNWFETAFKVPEALIRRIQIVCDRDDLEVQIPGAVRLVKSIHEEGKTAIIDAYMGSGYDLSMRWKPEIKELDSKLTMMAEVNTIANAGVGGLKTTTIFRYNIVQGGLKELEITVPLEFNITRVDGSDIQDWSLIDSENHNILRVYLNRPQEIDYVIRIDGESTLAPFPSDFHVPVLVPKGVIRADGFLAVGTDSAIKLIVDTVVGLSQIDESAFPEETKRFVAYYPSRNIFTYAFASLPYSLKMNADNIVPSIFADNQLIVTVKDNDLILDATVELDVRDAPMNEIHLRIPAGFSVSNVAGRSIVDYRRELRNGQTILNVIFQDGIVGRRIINIKLEKLIKSWDAAIPLPYIHVHGAKTERGFLALAAGEGRRIKPLELSGLREVLTGSLPANVPNAVLAYRFMDQDWSGKVHVDRKKSTVSAEIFHLVSLGENVLYGSSIITYHISGAPVNRFKVSIPEFYLNIEITGKDVRHWQKTSGVWEVILQDNIVGDYTLLVTYEHPFPAEVADFQIGGIESLDSEFESGFIAIAGASGMKLEHGDFTGKTLHIEPEEIPQAYRILVDKPILTAFKYVQRPHAVDIKLSAYRSYGLLDLVIDHTEIKTQVNNKGEVVSTAKYWVKNSSHQHLAVKLPQDAKLWNVKVDNRSVQAAANKQQLLIPLHRHRDPNTPIQVELTFAQKIPELNSGQLFSLRAPKTSAQATFTQWQLAFPQNFSLDNLTSNLLLSTARGNPRTAGIASQIFALTSRIVSDQTRAVAIGLGFLSILVLGYSFTHRWWRVFTTLVFGSLLTISLMLIMQGRLTNLLPKHQQWKLVNTLNLSKTINLAEGELLIQGELVDHRATYKRKLIASVGLGLISVTCIGLAFRTQFFPALVTALICAYFSCRGWPLAEMVFVVFVVCAVPVSFVTVVLRWMWRHGEPYRCRPETVPQSAPTMTTGLILCLTGCLMNPTAKGSEDFGLLPELTLIAAKSESPVSTTMLVAANRDESDAQLTTNIKPQADSDQAVTKLLTSRKADLPITAHESSDDGSPQKGATPLSSNIETEPVRCYKLDNAHYEILIDASEERKHAKIKCHITLTADKKNQRYHIIPTPGVLLETQFSDRDLYLEKDNYGYSMRTRRKGEFNANFTYLIPIAEDDGTFTLRTSVVDTITHTVVVTLPSTNLEITSPDAIYLATEILDDATVVNALFGVDNLICLSWRPRSRQTKLEDVVFYAETQSVFIFDEGVIDIEHKLRCQIAQGELSHIQLQLPQSQHVTSVVAKNLYTWRFDPSSQLLEIFFSKPSILDKTVSIHTQMAVSELPNTDALDVPLVINSTRQRGILGLTAAPSVRIKIAEDHNLNPINPADFPIANFTLAEDIITAKTPLLFPYRYFRLPIRIEVTAAKVKPEIRAISRNHLSVSDERFVLTSELTVDISRAGIFSLTLQLPDAYGIESLSGQGISHWDDIRENGHKVMIHFNQKTLGNCRIQIVLTTADSVEDSLLAIPNIGVVGETRHTGTLVVVCERGIRLSAAERRGVSELNPSELGIRIKSALAYKILQPNWSLKLRRESVLPWIQVESLQTHRISDGIVHSTCYFRYKLENAGSKLFYLRSPKPDLALDIEGKNIANIEQKEEGAWAVELHNKVHHTYALKVRYQYSFDPDEGRIDVSPVRALHTNLQRGYAAVLADPSLKIFVDEGAIGVKEVDPRGIPDVFGARGLSGATHCFRSLDADYNFTVRIQRFGAADMLPAQVYKVEIDTVVTGDGQQMSEARIKLDPGSKRFLRLQLPSRSRLWSIFVNNTPINPWQEEAAILVPLEHVVGADALLDIVCIYVTASSAEWVFDDQIFHSPQIDLPLRNIDWKLYLPPDSEYTDFGGTLNHVAGRHGFFVWDVEKYRMSNQSSAEGHRRQAKQFLEDGSKYAVKGEQRKAKKAFETAMQLSNLDVDLNEDARVQLRNVQRQNAIVGLIKRRGELPFKLSSDPHGQEVVVDDINFNEGRFSNEFAREVEQSLSLDESKNLTQMADKIMDQQFAAISKVQPLRINFPQQGKQVHFKRELQITPNATMMIRFNAERLDPAVPLSEEWTKSAFLFLIFVLVSGLLLGWKPGPPRARFSPSC